ncbi:hypothetical protein BD324DRAFT_625124 [Kockovaella imperatae]|uniref:UspA domain-containing protein n=1 Tax=Kockovaella imperatae TaxID=4999 RepID=A0A1Y1UGJ9_9TREE|nr:hypothetical protein BD324DRAFT_625124 [Kockovaella imperatae]ORX37190.1 hypothetical protein BD324DRAFT_625124 [Kockovaella imperatae]
MAPLNRSSSLPVNVNASTNLSRFKVFSGRGVTAEEPTPQPSRAEPQSSSLLGAFERGRSSLFKQRSATDDTRLPSQPVGASSTSRRPPSPFFRARRSREKARARESSPEVGPLEKDQVESDVESIAGGSTRHFEPQVSAYEDDSDDDLENEADVLPDPETTKNTLANAVFFDAPEGLDEDVLDVFGEEIEQDPLGEGPNVIVPLPPTFPSTAQPKRRPTKGRLPLTTSRPVFARDRCTITLNHGDPDGALEESGKRLRRYVVLSDLSDESRYAVEWAIGTVARDGDEIFVISVKEDEDKVDPKSWSDTAAKVKIQKERQTATLVLVREVTSLLQRTHLNITVTCQFLHAKNARHMLLDLIDFLEPSMAIVGSRGLGKLKGILLGSTSHYLVQKSSVPVMVARRRLYRPLRKTDPSQLRHSPRVSLASASIEKTASSKQEDEVVDLAQQEGDEEKPE